MESDLDIRQIRQDLRKTSRRLFGKMHRLETAAFISALEPPVWARQIARPLEIGENQAASELADFEVLGALQHFPDSFDRRKIYQVIPNPLWGFARKSLEETIRAGDPQSGEIRVAAYWASILGRSPSRPIAEVEDQR